MDEETEAAYGCVLGNGSLYLTSNLVLRILILRKFVI